MVVLASITILLATWGPKFNAPLRLWPNRDNLRAASAAGKLPALPNGVAELVLPLELFFGPEDREKEQFYTQRLRPHLIKAAHAQGAKTTWILTPFRYGPLYRPAPDEIEHSAFTAFRKNAVSDRLHPWLSEARLNFLRQQLAEVTSDATPANVVLDMRYHMSIPYMHSLRSRADAIEQLNLDPVDLASLSDSTWDRAYDTAPTKTQTSLIAMSRYRRALLAKQSGWVMKQLGVVPVGILTFGRELTRTPALGTGFDVTLLGAVFPGSRIICGLSTPEDVDGLLRIPAHLPSLFTALINDDVLAMLLVNPHYAKNQSKWSPSPYSLEELK